MDTEHTEGGFCKSCPVSLYHDDVLKLLIFRWRRNRHHVTFVDARPCCRHFRAVIVVLCLILSIIAMFSPPSIRRLHLDPRFLAAVEMSSSRHLRPFPAVVGASPSPLNRHHCAPLTLTQILQPPFVWQW